MRTISTIAILGALVSACGGSADDPTPVTASEADSGSLTDTATTIDSNVADTAPSDSTVTAEDSGTDVVTADSLDSSADDTPSTDTAAADVAEVSADAGDAETTDAIVDTAPLPVTLNFVVAPGGDSGVADMAALWLGGNARLDPLEKVEGYRHLYGPSPKTKWESWSATINFDLKDLTCKDVKVYVYVLWRAIDPTTLIENSYSSRVEIRVGSGVPSYTVNGWFTTPGPTPPEGGFTYSEVRLMVTRIGDGCGRLWAKPSTYTFNPAP